jgi:hypothetical protein
MEEMCVSYVAETLETITSENMVSLEMDLLAPGTEDWDQLHEVLHHPRFRKLQYLCIRAPEDEMDPDHEVRDDLLALANLPGFRFESLGRL